MLWTMLTNSPDLVVPEMRSPPTLDLAHDSFLGSNRLAFEFFLLFLTLVLFVAIGK